MDDVVVGMESTGHYWLKSDDVEEFEVRRVQP